MADKDFKSRNLKKTTSIINIVKKMKNVKFQAKKESLSKEIEEKRTK